MKDVLKKKKIYSQQEKTKDYPPPSPSQDFIKVQLITSAG